MNARLMFFEYIEHFYKKEVKVDREKVNGLVDTFHGAIITQTWADKHITTPDYVENKVHKEEEEVTNPAIILSNWKDYEYGPIHFTKKYSDEVEKLNLLIASPLIPVKLKIELEKFDRLVKDNLSLIGKMLNEIAQELPQKFSTVSSIEKFEPIGIWNKYNRKMEDFEPVSNEILKYIRTYLKIDKLIE